MPEMLMRMRLVPALSYPCSAISLLYMKFDWQGGARLTLRLGSVPRAAARRVNAVEMCPALGSPGKSALIRHTFSGCASSRSLPSSSRIGTLIATAVSGALAAFGAGPVMHTPVRQTQQSRRHLQTQPPTLRSLSACRHGLHVATPPNAQM